MYVFKKYIFFGLAILFFLAIPFWYLFFFPEVNEIPHNFSYEAKVNSSDNFYDQETGKYLGEQRSDSIFSYKVLSGNSNFLEIENLFDVHTLSGESIFSVKRVYGVDSHTGQHLNGHGDRDREGYLFGPRMKGIGAQVPDKSSFKYWHINYDNPIDMFFQNEDKIFGLKVYHYVSSFEADQTKDLTNLPGVGENLGINLDVTLSLWIEPTTGFLVKYEDDAVAYYYDLNTKERLSPWNHFHNYVSDVSVADNAFSALIQKQKYYIFIFFIPGVFLILALIFLLQGTVKRKIWSKLPNKIKTFILPIITFLFILTISLLLWNLTRTFISQIQESEFLSDTELMNEDIINRLEIYTSALLGGRGLFDASYQVDRSEWRNYVDSLNIKRYYPGIQGFGYSMWVEPSDLEKHISEVRSEGFPYYTVHPEGDRPMYSTTVFIEPLDKLNIEAFGFDMYQERTRRIAMDRAKDTDEVSLTGKVRLVQEVDPNDIQSGFLLYVPVYKKGAPLLTIEDKRKASLGFVFSPFRMNDFIRGVFSANYQNINVEIFDGSDFNNLSESRRMYGLPTNLNSELSFSRLINFAGHSWVVRYSSSAQFSEHPIQNSLPLIVLIFGFISSVFSSIFFHIINTRRVLAVKIANSITLDLKKERERLDNIINGTNLGTWEWNVKTGETKFNERCAKIIGYSLKELEPISIKTWEKYVNPEDLKAKQKMLEKHFSGEIEYYSFEYRMKHKDGHWVWVLDRGKVISRTIYGKPLLMYGTRQDITEQKEAENDFKERAEELERVNKLMVDRELKMMELKKAMAKNLPRSIKKKNSK